MSLCVYNSSPGVRDSSNFPASLQVQTQTPFFRITKILISCFPNLSFNRPAALTFLSYWQDNIIPMSHPTTHHNLPRRSLSPSAPTGDSLLWMSARNKGVFFAINVMIHGPNSTNEGNDTLHISSFPAQMDKYISIQCHPHTHVIW